jgi:asparagine synthase (glutamine-hydrolysing)
VDPLGLARYLVYDGMPDTRTIYRGVSKVPAAGWLEMTSEGHIHRQGRYWHFPAPFSEGGADGEVPDEAAAVDGFLEDLDRAVQLRLRSDVPVGLFLSGGVDSSLLAAAWRHIRPEGELRTFTIGFEEPSFDERASARLVAEALGARHEEVVIHGHDLEAALDGIWNHLSEPFADPSIVPTSLLCRFARERVTVALGGDGGDELQAGYDPFRAWRAARWMERVLPRRLWYGGLKTAEALLPPAPTNMSLRFKVRHFAHGFLHGPEERIQGWMASFPLPQALAVMHPDLAAQVDPEEVLEPTRRAYREAIQYGELHAQIHVWIRTYLECSILTKIDRASMMHSLEVRAPFLDPQLAERLLRLPPRLIFRKGKGKYLMRRAAERRLPPALLKKPKKGLGVPQAEWLRTLLRPRMEAALERNRQGGWFAPEAIETLWRRHASGRYDCRKALWAFLFAYPFQDRTL